jgi:predicted ribosomally synthesized peptide with SipW-like signal peptide
MKKIIGLALMFLLTLAAVAGGTAAYFNDIEDSTGNVIASGTLDLGLANSAAQEPSLGTTQTWYLSSPGAWKPGDTLEGSLYLYNGGTIDITSVTVAFTYDSVVDGTPATVYGYDGTADTDKLDKMVYASVAEYNGVTVAEIEGKTLEELAAAGEISLSGVLASLAEKELYIEWTFDAAATNGCQGDTVTLTVTVTGT